MNKPNLGWLGKLRSVTPTEPPPLPAQDRVETHPQPVRVPEQVEPETYEVVVKAPKDQQTVADVLDYLCKRFGGTYERFIPDDGGVSVAMNFTDGERIVGKGKTTAEAVRALRSRLEK